MRPPYLSRFFAILLFRAGQIQAMADWIQSASVVLMCRRRLTRCDIGSVSYISINKTVSVEKF